MFLLWIYGGGGWTRTNNIRVGAGGFALAYAPQNEVTVREHLSERSDILLTKFPYGNKRGKAGFEPATFRREPDALSL